METQVQFCPQVEWTKKQVLQILGLVYLAKAKVGKAKAKAKIDQILLGAVYT